MKTTPMKFHISILTLMLLAAPIPACRACGIVDADFRPTSAPVIISQESAIIFWDEANHREHFVRRAEFNTQKRDIGFLVPTPSVPKLAEAKDSVFARVAGFTAPKIVYKVSRHYEARPLIRFLMPMSSMEESGAPAIGAAKPAVKVLSWQKVAGYEAVVLGAEDTTALGRWLKAHGYVARPAVLKWLKPYVKKRWKITAFKVARANKNAPLQTAAVRMSFDTPRPFYPYSEPQNPNQKAPPSRWLQLFFFALNRVEGKLESEEAWPGTVKYAAPTSMWETMRLLGLQPIFTTNDSPAWLTAFDDISTTRGTEDVYFEKEATQANIIPPPIIREIDEDVPVPADLIVVVVLGSLIWWFKRRGTRTALLQKS